MKRTNFLPFNVDGILTSDWHMMPKEYNPPCRIDNHFKAQGNKIKQIRRLRRKYDCDIFNAGDLFDHWKGSPELINHCFRIFPVRMKGIAGQHDLPQHNFDLMYKSSFESLVRGGAYEFLYGQGHWGQDLKKIKYYEYKGRRIIILHLLVWKDDEPFPGSTDPRVDSIFKMFPKADLILTGDNHQTFTARKGSQILVNPGSLTRFKANQVDHKPCVFLYDAKRNAIKRHYLKVKNNVISRDHIDDIQDKEERGEAFISSLNNEWLADLSYDDNIDSAIKVNDLSKLVTKYVYKWIGR